MVPPRLCLNKRTFEALKIKNSLFLAIFLRKFILQGPHTQKISLFSLLPHSHMSKLWYDTKIWKKSPNFPAISHFVSLLHSTYMDLGQAFFLYNTKKLSSRFSKTQIPKISENSVFAPKLSSKPPENWVFKIFFSRNHKKMDIFCLKPPKFSENSDPKSQKLSFSEILKSK